MTPSSVLHVVRAEVGDWLRAFLRAIPGEIGCFVRNRFYGYKSGRGCRVLPSVVIHHPGRLVLADNVGISPGTQLNAAGGIRIEADTLIGPGCLIWSANHRYADRARPIRLQGYDLASVNIGPNCWIAAGCIILPGVCLGAGVVVAAGAVVTQSFPDNSIIAGVPARCIGLRGENPNHNKSS